MGKAFSQYPAERMPYSASEISYCLIRYAKNYINGEHKNISGIDSKIRDAVLVDVINHIAIMGCLDLALYTMDLYDGRKETEEVDPQCIVTALVNHGAYYMFDTGIVYSVLLNSHMNECTEAFDPNDGAKVLLDFINYVTKVNGYDNVFTMKDLYEKYKIQKHHMELRELSDFLKLTGIYGELLRDGNSVEELLNDMEDYEQKGEDGDALAYAFAKENRFGKTRYRRSKVKLIDKKIQEMKKR